MRSEREMLDLILEAAHSDDRVRAVILGGSRANPAAWRDVFQDFDIVFVVAAAPKSMATLEWIQPFGEVMIRQTPSLMGDAEASGDADWSVLMQFSDGNRIDLTLSPASAFKPESLAVVLLDKDGAYPSLPIPSERDFLPSPPTAREFADCTNEFWWVAPYVAKGLARGEIIYAKHHLDSVMRGELMRMLTWQLGVEAGFDRSAGKHGKEFRRLLSTEHWRLLTATYAGPEEEENWQALFAMAELFRQSGARVATAFDFEYPNGDDARVMAHLRRVWVGEFGSED